MIALIAEVASERMIPISALQHYIFCPRQCALIHTERVWAENALTYLGRREHRRVESAQTSVRGRVIEERSVQLYSDIMGIYGVADVVEYQYLDFGLQVTPIEYKHGSPKSHSADEVQLCAQAICLEEMHGIRIDKGYLFYQSHKRRIGIEFSEELRTLTIATIEETRRLLEAQILPEAIKRRECAACSLNAQCLPRKVLKSVKMYNNLEFAKTLADETTS